MAKWIPNFTAYDITKDGKVIGEQYVFDLGPSLAIGNLETESYSDARQVDPLVTRFLQSFFDFYNGLIENSMP
ncbi:MAG: hypothetical protein WCX65_14960 [bacterium]